MVCVAVFVVAPTAVSVKTTFAGDECENAPVTVPDVYGATRSRGLSIPSVFVMFALAGSLE